MTHLSHIPLNSFAGRIHSLNVESWPSPLNSSHGPSSLSWEMKISKSNSNWGGQKIGHVNSNRLGAHVDCVSYSHTNLQFLFHFFSGLFYFTWQDLWITGHHITLSYKQLHEMITTPYAHMYHMLHWAQVGVPNSIYIQYGHKFLATFVCLEESFHQVSISSS